MKLYMESVRDIRSQKPLRPTLWSLFLGILQTGMKKWENIFFSSDIDTKYCREAY